MEFLVFIHHSVKTIETNELFCSFMYCTFYYLITESLYGHGRRITLLPLSSTYADLITSNFLYSSISRLWSTFLFWNIVIWWNNLLCVVLWTVRSSLAFFTKNKGVLPNFPIRLLVINGFKRKLMSTREFFHRMKPRWFSISWCMQLSCDNQP